MKKSVIVISVLVIISFFILKGGITGHQALELPAPPPIPGMENDADDTVEDDLSYWEVDEDDSDLDEEVESEENESVYEYLTPEVQSPVYTESAVYTDYVLSNRVANLETQVSGCVDCGAKFDEVNSKVSAMSVEVDNLKRAVSRPYVDEPTLVETVDQMGRKNTVMSVVLSLLVLAILLGMIGFNIHSRFKEYEADKKIIREYLINYQKVGYSLDSLRMQLLASGWKASFIDDIIKGLRGAL